MSLALKWNSYRLGGAQRSNYAHHGGREDGVAKGFVVQANVTACHRYFKKAASLGKPLNRLDDLAHNLGPLRIPEIEIVSCGDWQRANCRQISAALSDD